MIVPSALTHLIPIFIEATLEQHAAAPGRSAGSGQRLTRSERREIAATGFAQLLDSRLPELREVIEAGDVTAEHRMLGELRLLAREHGQKNVDDVVNSAHRELLSDMGRAHPVQVGKWGKLQVWEDRVSLGDEAYRIDHYTEAQVFVDGQKQVTTRPSLTAALLFSPLPGSALIQAQRFGSKQTHDTRTASLVVGSTRFSWTLHVSPDQAASARALAQRINALADASTPAATATTTPTGDLLTQLERVAEMEAKGAITAEQATVLKERLIAQG